MQDSEREDVSPTDPTRVGLTEAVRRTIVQAVMPIGVDGAGCLLMDGEGALRYVGATGTPAQVLEVAEELCVEGPCHDAFAHGEVVYADLPSDRRWERLATLLATSPVRTVLGVPIMFDGEPIGALDAFSGLPQDWSETDVGRLHATADAIAALIRQALHEGLDRRGDDLTRQLRNAVQNRDVLRQAAELITRSTGFEPAASVLRLRQVAAATGLPTIDVAARVVESGSLPGMDELAEQAVFERRTRLEMARLALSDPLTGLANRVLFLDRLDQALARSRRGEQQPAVVFVDLDRFKTINDSLGHEAGDEVLRSIADRLLEVVRAEDTVSRLGGDEFAVLSEVPRDPELALQLAHRIAEAVSAPLMVSAHLPGTAERVTHEVSVSASVGVSVADVDSPPRATDVLRDADMAMYAAKAQGGERVAMFSQELREAGHRRMHRELGLRALIDGRAQPQKKPAPQGASDGLRLAYQPIVALRTGEIRGVEALARWTHPDLGEIPASDLIETAENAGLMIPLGRILLSEACLAAAGWTAELDLDELVVSVNVSPTQLADAGFSDAVDDVLMATGLAPGQLCLELTESRLLDAAGTTIDTLHQLAQSGVRLTLDDFGTGYSSLSYLSRLPVTQLKIDRAFVAGIGHDPHDTALAEAVVCLAHSLDLQAVAEGIETSEQAEWLADLDCELAQGYLFSPPVPARSVPALLTGGSLWRRSPS